MPDAWNKDHERQYIRVRACELERSKRESRAEQIAARTVNNQPSEDDRARELAIADRSRMDEEELTRAIREHDRENRAS